MSKNKRITSFNYQTTTNKAKYPDIKISGIYMITNKVNNKIYIGSAKNIYNRWHGHIAACGKIKKEQVITKAFVKYGIDNFEFEVIATCPESYLHKVEQWFLDNLKPEYNIRKIVDRNNGIIPSKETREKIKASLLKRTKSYYEQHSLKMLQRTLKRNNITEKDLAEYKGYIQQGIPLCVIKNYYKVSSKLLERLLVHKTLDYIKLSIQDTSHFNIIGCYDTLLNVYTEAYNRPVLVKRLNLDKLNPDTITRFIKENRIYRERYIFYSLKTKEEKIELYKSGKIAKEMLDKKLNFYKDRSKKHEGKYLHIYKVVNIDDPNDIFIGNKYEIAKNFKRCPNTIISSCSTKSVFCKHYKVYKAIL